MTRRHFLATGAAACAVPVGAAETAVEIVDTHTHFYDPLRKQGVPWPSKGTSLYRPVYPKDWLAVAQPHGVTRTVVIEASPWLEDNQWILDLAAHEPCIVGSMGHLLPHEARFDAQLKRFAANPLFRGLRVNHRDFLDHVQDPPFLGGVKLMADLGLALEINGPSSVLAPVAKLAVDIPSLRIIVENCGGSGDPKNLSAEWRNGLKGLVRQANVYCKACALVEQARPTGPTGGAAPRDPAYYVPILDPLWESFGPDRLIYGSDWPVSEHSAPYDVVFRIVDEYFSAKGREAREKYFSMNSKAAYQWVARGS